MLPPATAWSRWPRRCSSRSARSRASSRTPAAAGVPAATLEAVRDFAQRHYVDLKRQDALELLRAIRDLPLPAPAERPTFEFQRTALFEGLYNRDRKVRHDDFDVPLVSHRELGRRCTCPSSSDLNFHALNRGLVGLLGELLEVRPTADDVDREEQQRFRSSRRLADERPSSSGSGATTSTPPEFRSS